MEMADRSTPIGFSQPLLHGGINGFSAGTLRADGGIDISQAIPLLIEQVNGLPKQGYARHVLVLSLGIGKMVSDVP